MKTSIVAPVGRSPPVITEFLRYVIDVFGEKVTDMTLLVTKDPEVQYGLKLIEVAIKDKYPFIHIHIKELPFEDIDSEERSIEFMEYAARVLKEEETIHKVDRIYLCVAGGRKDMCIILSLLAQFYKVNGVYHVIAPEIKIVSEKLERLRKEIEELAKSSNPEEKYKENKQQFEELMFPSRSRYVVIKIPVIPYPKDTLKKIVNLLKNKTTPKNEVKISFELLENLQSIGLIKIGTRNITTTLDGIKLLKILENTILKEGL